MNAADREALKARLRAQAKMPAREYVANLLHAARTHADAEAMLDEITAEAVQEERQEREADRRTWQHDLKALRAAQEEIARLREENADVSRLARVERLVEEARDKGNTYIDTDLLLDALGLAP